jgi:hypothetical protein
MKGTSEAVLIAVVSIIAGILAILLFTNYGTTFVKLLTGLFSGVTRSFQAMLCGMLGGTGKLIFGGLC